MSKRRRGRQLAKLQSAGLALKDHDQTVLQESGTGPRDGQSKFDLFCKVIALVASGFTIVKIVIPVLNLLYEWIIRHLPCIQSGRRIRFQILRPAGLLAGRNVFHSHIVL